MNILDWEWIPNKSIGIFFFETKVQLSLLPFAFTKVNLEDEIESWSIYEIVEDKTRFSVEQGVLTSVECCTNFIYKGKNLINMPTDEAVAIIGKPFSIVDNWIGGAEYLCKELGIIIWDEEGRVESISVSI